MQEIVFYKTLTKCGKFVHFEVETLWQVERRFYFMKLRNV